MPERPRTEQLRNKEKQLIWKLLYPTTDHARPQTRNDCVNGPRPCPYVGCRYNLYLEETTSLSIRFMFPHLEPWEMEPTRSCTLDVAEQGDHTLDEVGTFINVTRERIRQIEYVALKKALKGLDED